MGKFASILPISPSVNSAVGKKKKKKKKCLECQCQKQASLLPSQLFSFPSIALTVLENDAAKGETSETTEYQLSRAIIPNHFYRTYTVLSVWGGLVSLVHNLYRLSLRG